MEMGFSNAELFSVDDVVQRSTLEIPEFQRGYAWREDQWKALWEDVSSIVERGTGSHYTGSIMIGAPDQSGVCELIDGQQRMVTIALMLSALGGKAYPITFRQNDVLQACFDYHALGQKHLEAAVSRHNSYYARNISLAWEFFDKQAAPLHEANAAQPYINALRHQLRLFVLTIQPEFDIHVAFETINNRGRPLSTLEKLKNRLIYLASQAPNAAQGKEAAAEIHRCWKEIYHFLGAGRELLGDDDFLLAHATGWFRVERVYDWLGIKLFDEEFSARNPVDIDRIVAYVRSLERAAACWHLLHEADKLPPAVSQRLHNLGRTKSGATRPLLLWALVKISEAYPTLLLHPEESDTWTKPFADLVLESERFGALVIQASKRPAHVGKSDLSRSAHAMVTKEMSLLTPSRKLPEPSNVLDSVSAATRHLRSLVCNVSGTDDSGDEVFIHPEFNWHGYFGREHVLATINDRFTKKDAKGFYGWSFSKLVLMAWEERLRGMAGKPEKRSWEKFQWTDSVEHIYPQTPSAGWKEWIEIKGRGQERSSSIISGSLGNLLLLSQPVNSSLSNHAFHDDGDKVGKRTRFANGSYSELQINRICNKWTVVEIAARGIAMLQHAQKHWDFELVPEGAKEREWLPYLFGPLAERVRTGDFYGGSPVDGRNLRPLIEQFNEMHK